MHVKRKSKLFVFLRKSVALFVSFSFILSESVSYAQIRESGIVDRDSSKPPLHDTRTTIHSISIPEELGRIEESFIASRSPIHDSRPTIVYLQDAHDSLEAQENIAKLIHYFVEHYGVKTVFEEGYEGPVPTDEYFGFIKDPQIKEKVSYFLMDKLRIGGAEYAHINRKRDFNLIGADNIKLHLENIAWYRENAIYREQTEKDLHALHAQIQKLANRYFPKELKEWMKLKRRFDEKQIPLLDYLKRTLSLQSTIHESQYPNLALPLSAEHTQDKVILEQIKQIDPKTLFEEINRLENDFADALLQNERGKQIFHYHKSLTLLKRLNEIELTPPEYETVKETLQSLNTREMAEFIAKQTRKSIILSKRWEENIQSAIRFYEISQTRDHVIKETLDRYVVTPRSDSRDIALLLFGGFHKERIKEILRQKNLSSVIVSPKITDIDAKHRDYYKRLMSVGYLPFEIPLYVRQAARAESRFLQVKKGGIKIEAAFRSELRALTESLQQNVSLDRSDFLLRAEQALPKNIRSEVRSGTQSYDPKEFERQKQGLREEAYGEEALTARLDTNIEMMGGPEVFLSLKGFMNTYLKRLIIGFDQVRENLGGAFGRDAIPPLFQTLLPMDREDDYSFGIVNTLETLGSIGAELHSPEDILHALLSQKGASFEEAYIYLWLLISVDNRIQADRIQDHMPALRSAILRFLNQKRIGPAAQRELGRLLEKSRIVSSAFLNQALAGDQEALRIILLSPQLTRRVWEATEAGRRSNLLMSVINLALENVFNEVVEQQAQMAADLTPDQPYSRPKREARRIDQKFMEDFLAQVGIALSLGDSLENLLNPEMFRLTEDRLIVTPVYMITRATRGGDYIDTEDAMDIARGLAPYTFAYPGMTLEYVKVPTIHEIDLVTMIGRRMVDGTVAKNVWKTQVDGQPVNYTTTKTGIPKVAYSGSYVIDEADQMSVYKRAAKIHYAERWEKQILFSALRTFQSANDVATARDSVLEIQAALAALRRLGQIYGKDRPAIYPGYYFRSASQKAFRKILTLIGEEELKTAYKELTVLHTMKLLILEAENMRNTYEDYGLQKAPSSRSEVRSFKQDEQWIADLGKDFKEVAGDKLDNLHKVEVLPIIDAYRIRNKIYLVWSKGSKKGKIFWIQGKPPAETFSSFSAGIVKKQIKKYLGDIDRLVKANRISEAKQLNDEFAQYLHQAYYALTEIQFYDEASYEYVLEIQSYSSIEEWLKKSFESQFPDLFRERKRPAGVLIWLDSGKPLPFDLGVFQPGHRHPLYYFRGDTFNDPSDPIRLTHESVFSSLPGIVAKGGLASRSIYGENTASWELDPDGVKINHWSKPKQIHLFDFSIVFAVGRSRFSDLKLFPATSGVAGEKITKKLVPLNKITHVFAPVFAVDLTRRILHSHGYAHIKVLPFGYIPRSRSFSILGRSEIRDHFNQVMNHPGFKRFNVLDANRDGMFDRNPIFAPGGPLTLLWIHPELFNNFARSVGYVSFLKWLDAFNLDETIFKHYQNGGLVFNRDSINKGIQYKEKVLVAFGNHVFEYLDKNPRLERQMERAIVNRLAPGGFTSVGFVGDRRFTEVPYVGYRLKSHGQAFGRAEVRKVGKATSSRLTRGEAVHPFQEKYAVVVDMNVFDALEEEQRVEAYKLIASYSEGQRVKFIFNMVGDRALDRTYRNLQDLKERFGNVEIRVNPPPTSFDFQDRKVISVSKEGIQEFYSRFIEEKLKGSKDFYSVRYRQGNKAPGLLTAALLLLDSGKAEFFQGKSFSDIPVGLGLEHQIAAILGAYVYIGCSA